MCQTFQSLPRPGGLFDQDCYFVLGMNIVLAAQSKRAKKDAEDKAKHSAPRR